MMFVLRGPAFRVTLDWAKRVHVTPSEVIRVSVPEIWTWD